MMTSSPIPRHRRLAWTVAAAGGLLSAHAAPPASAQPTTLTPPPAADRSVLATPLPAPPLSPGSPPLSYLQAARSALGRGRTGEARESLERAETRLLDRSVDPAVAGRPDTNRAVLDIGVARQALNGRDRFGASRAIDDAIAALVSPAPVAAAIAMPPLAQPSFLPEAPPGPPPVTKALLPSHWRLRGANWVWVPPETHSRRVEDRPLVLGAYVWREGAWRWVPAHYSGS